MPWFIPALTATATLALARKIVARYWHGLHAHHAQADPPGLRTVARFTSDTPSEVLHAVAAVLERDLGESLEITRDAIRARPDADDTRVDIVRLAHRDARTHTLELTRAWTGVYLGEQTRYLLGRIHDALTRRAGDVAWFARQDRALATPHATPFDEPATAAR